MRSNFAANAALILILAAPVLAQSTQPSELIESALGASAAKIRAAAENGDPKSQALLGYTYLFEGRKRSAPAHFATEAFKWLKLATDQGNEIAQCGLGEMYRDGVGVPVNDLKAFVLFNKSANSGFPHGQFNLGMAYLLGQGTPKDEKRGVALIVTAAENKDAMATYALGGIYHRGEYGMAQSDEKAIEWYRKTVALGIDSAEREIEEIKTKQADGIKDQRSKTVIEQITPIRNKALQLLADRKNETNEYKQMELERQAYQLLQEAGTIAANARTEGWANGELRSLGVRCFLESHSAARVLKMVEIDLSDRWIVNSEDFADSVAFTIECLLKTRQLKKAMAVFERLNEIYPRSKATQHAKQLIEKARSLEPTIKEVDMHLELGDYDKVEEMLEPIIKEGTSAPIAMDWVLSKAATAAYETKQYRKALAYCNLIIAIQPDNSILERAKQMLPRIKARMDAGK